MNVFVTGAGGYIGNRLVRALYRAGHDVLGLDLSKEALDRLGYFCAEPITGNLVEPDSFQSKASRCDAIIHLGLDHGKAMQKIDRAAVETLIAAASGKNTPRVLIYTSGIAVIGDTAGKTVDETVEVQPPDLVAWRPIHEKIVLESGDDQLVTAIVRPGLVFGSYGGVTSRLFETAVNQEASSFVGDGQNRMSPVHIDDLVDIYVRVVELADEGPLFNLKPEQRIFHGVCGTAERIEDIARAASSAAGQEGRIKLTPVEEARQKIGGMAQALTADQVVVAPYTQKYLGWRPKFRGFVRNAVEVFLEWRQGRAQSQ